MKKKGIPYCPKPRNTFERVYLNILKAKRTRPKRGESKEV